MSSKKRMAGLVGIALVMGATSVDASRTPASAQPPMSVAVSPASIAAIPHEDANQLVLGYLEYMDSLKGPEEVSLARMQAAVGSQLRQGEFGYVNSVYPEGDWVTFSFWDEGPTTMLTASLNFLNDRSSGEALPPCRLSLDSLRDRLSRGGYAEGREWSELEGAGAWLFSKDDVWIEVSTQWPATNASNPSCVTAINAHGKF